MKVGDRRLRLRLTQDHNIVAFVSLVHITWNLFTDLMGVTVQEEGEGADIMEGSPEMGEE